MGRDGKVLKGTVAAGAIALGGLVAPAAWAQVKQGAEGVPAEAGVGVNVKAAGPAAAGAGKAGAALNRAEVDRLIGDLSSPDFKARDAATRGLVENPAMTLAEVEAAVKQRGEALPPEGRERLLTIGRDRFFKSPRAAMGIAFGATPGSGGVDLPDRISVGQTYPEFESHKVLETGDLITHADGQDMRGPDATFRMQAIIVSHDPGDAIPLVVRRGKAKLKLEVHLGKFSDLPNTAIDTDRLARAWRYRSRGYAQDPTPPLRVRAGPADWDSPGRERQSQRVTARRRQLEDQKALPSIVGGGMARVALGEEEADPLQQRVVIMNNGRAQVVAVAGGMVGGAAFRGMADVRRAPMTTAQELKKIDEAIKLEQDGRRTPGPVVDTDSLKRLSMLKKQQDAIRADMAERGESESDPTAGGKDNEGD